jgi:hypothetical protein
MYLFLVLMCVSFSHPVHQASKGVKTSYNALLELLESIKHLLRHLDIYTQISPTPAMDDMVVKIMVEILFTLAVTVKELKQGRPSQFVLVNMFHRLKEAQRNS